MSAGGQFDRPDVVESYRPRQALTATEQDLVERHVATGASVLDLGVGAGRTTGALAARAGRYVGIDVAPSMVAAARQAHPEADLRVGDAADLSAFADGSFDVVVFSFNGIDYLEPDAARHRCLDEVRRVLRPGGTFLFSTHDPRALGSRPTPGSGAKGWTLAGLRVARRCRDRLASRALWRGEGWVTDRVGVGFRTHMATPERVVAELAAHGFDHLETVADAPDGGGRWSTAWWYHAAVRPAEG